MRLSSLLLIVAACCFADLSAADDVLVSTSVPVPHAVIYRTNGNFVDNVPVTLSADGKHLVSYPAPSDLIDSQRPIVLSDAFMLDRRGIGPHTAFTHWTYDEYREMSQPPTPRQIMDAIIKGAMVTEIVKLPIRASAADTHIETIDSLIHKGLPGCEILLKRRAVLLSPEPLYQVEPIYINNDSVSQYQD